MDNTTKNSTFLAEQKSGKLWWNTGDVIKCDGEVIIKIPQCSSIARFVVYDDHIMVGYWQDEVQEISN